MRLRSDKTWDFRIFDRYGRRVASFAILADDKSDWRPDGFGYTLLGCKIDFRFPTVKLLDFVGHEAELEANPNPFAVVILAFLSARQTANDDDRRKISKIRLIRSLYDRGLDRTANTPEDLTRTLDGLAKPTAN